MFVADVHIVSAFRRNHNIGRPIIYFVVDRASRMIVGMHVSLLYASWNAAINAIVNTGMNKVEYCARFGVKIEEADWPCSHLSQLLLVDRGEMIGLSPEKLVVPLMDLKIAPPYRADMKTMVERRFGLVNDQVIHRLPGTTKGKMLSRGLPDPRTKARYTLTEFTKVMIEAVIALNHKQYDQLANSNTTLIKNDLAPTPINYMTARINSGLHALKKIDSDQLRAQLLPEVQVSVTEMGIKYEEMYYSCKKAETENWFSVARKKKRWRLRGRAHDDDTNYIFIYDDATDAYIPCYLLSRSAKMFKDQSISDIYYFQDWRKSKKHHQTINEHQVIAHQSKSDLDKLSEQKQKEAPPLLTKRERTQDVKQRRKNEIKNTYEAEIRENSVEASNVNTTENVSSLGMSREEKRLALLRSIDD